MCENKQLLYLVDPFPDPASQNIYIFNETVYSNPLTPQSSHPPPPPLTLTYPDGPYKAPNLNPPRALTYPDPYKAPNLNPPSHTYIS